MQDESMINANKMLLYRTILCFGDEGSESQTVTGIARKLQVEKYQISRILTTLEQQDILVKNEKGVPSLTKKGKEYIREYHKRVELLVSFLLRAKLEPQYARNIALHIAGHANDDIMNLIESHDKKWKSKEELEKKIKFSGGQFARSMKKGNYDLACVLLYRNEQNFLEFVAQESPHRLVLSVVAKKGTLQFHSGTPKLKELRYFDHGDFIQAEKVGDMFFLPAEILQFVQMKAGSICETGFLGMVNVQMKLEEGTDCVEKPGIFEIIF